MSRIFAAVWARRPVWVPALLEPAAFQAPAPTKEAWENPSCPPKAYKFKVFGVCSGALPNMLYPQHITPPPGPTEETALTVLVGFSSSRDAFSLHELFFCLWEQLSRGRPCQMQPQRRKQTAELCLCGGRPWWAVREGMTLTAPPSMTLSLCQVDDAPSH